MVADLVKQIKDSGVRFLKQSEESSSSKPPANAKNKNDKNAFLGGWWVEVSDEIARGKVSHAFRNTKLLKGMALTKYSTPSGRGKKNSINTDNSKPTSIMSVKDKAAYDSDGSSNCNCFCG